MARPKQGPRKARNKWTHQQRLTLHLIHTRFSLTPAQRAKVFNSIFAEDLRRCGYTDGLGVSALSSQYGETTKDTPSAVAAWRAILRGPAGDDETDKREEIVRKIEETGQQVLGLTLKGRKGVGEGLAAKTTTRTAKSTTATQVSYNNPSTRFVNMQPGDLATKYGYETPTSSAPLNFSIRRHTVSFTDGPEDGNNVTQTPTARSNAITATRPSVMKRTHEGLSRCNPSTPTTLDAAELAGSGDETVPELLRKQRRITAADFKRPNSTSARLTHDLEDEDDSEQNVELMPTQTVSRESPEVVVPTPPKRRGRPRKNVPSDVLSTPPRTPGTPTKRRGPGSRKPDAIHPYKYPSGNLIYLTKSELEETERDLVPVAEDVHRLPYAGRLFRYWNDDCQSKLDVQGEFVAGRFATTIISPPPVPSMKDFPWSDAAIHLNHCYAICLGVEQFHVDHPSRHQEKDRGVQNGRITLIDPHQMDHKTIFHAQPFHRALCKKKPFENAAFMYHGMHEFMVYHKVPRNAILHTFAISDLTTFVHSSAAVDRVLRLSVLGAERKSYATKILPSLKAGNIALSPETITAMTQIARFLNLSPASPIEHVMHIVSDIIQGWAFTITSNTPSGWSECANIFANAMNDCAAPTDLKGHQNMKLAFLDGVRWSRGDFNVRHKAERMKTMLTRAKKIGLEDPAKIVCGELDAVKMNLMLYEKKQQRILQGNGMRGLVTEAGEEQGEEEEGALVMPNPGMFEAGDEIVYEEDEDGY